MVCIRDRYAYRASFDKSLFTRLGAEWGADNGRAMKYCCDYLKCDISYGVGFERVELNKENRTWMNARDA